ncbi:hypothetical protein ACQBAR_05360 [Propionibacteriaceae bacterium Y1685]|uniref:hypothetical protein n=1 Tax=Microlunatus sp. Y1700 TaxID=3418487 RepID=UPI003B7C53C3
MGSTRVERPALTRPVGPRRATSESIGIWIALGSFLVGMAIGVVRLWGRGSGLFGADSIGEVAALTSAGLSALIFAVLYVVIERRPTHTWRKKLRLPFRILDGVGLTFTHGAIALFVMITLFWIFDHAFIALTLDPWAGGTIIGVASAIATYLTAASAVSMSTRSVSGVLAVFMASGVLSSMLFSSDPAWWQLYFSALGAATDFSGVAFNFTLIAGGLVITTLASYLTHDLSRWAGRLDIDPWRIRVIWWAFIVLGLLLTLVGLLPVNNYFVAHNLVAYSMAGLFIVLVIGLPFLLPEFPRTFALFSWGIAVSVGLSFVMYYFVHYLNLTAFELITVAVVFGWLIVFVRNVDAIASDRERDRTGASPLAG